MKSVDIAKMSKKEQWENVIGEYDIAYNEDQLSMCGLPDEEWGPYVCKNIQFYYKPPAGKLSFANIRPHFTPGIPEDELREIKHLSYDEMQMEAKKAFTRLYEKLPIKLKEIDRRLEGVLDFEIRSGNWNSAKDQLENSSVYYYPTIEDSIKRENKLKLFPYSELSDGFPKNRQQFFRENFESIATAQILFLEILEGRKLNPDDFVRGTENIRSPDGAFRIDSIPQLDPDEEEQVQYLEELLKRNK